MTGPVEVARPSLGRIVHYRGKYGMQLTRAALITCDPPHLDHRGVESGAVPALDSPMHVHLWVYTPALNGPNAAAGGFPEFNVPYGDSPGEWHWPPRV